MFSQYGELRPTSGWDRFGCLGHPSEFQRVWRLGLVTAATSLTGGQQNFDLRPSPGLVHIAIFTTPPCNRQATRRTYPHDHDIYRASTASCGENWPQYFGSSSVPCLQSGTPSQNLYLGMHIFFLSPRHIFLPGGQSPAVTSSVWSITFWRPALLQSTNTVFWADT